ncbi:MAG: aminoglycoside phosphotransferase family protein [Anaerolineae bacterium]|nr:aminoglycoside phosphotransferase family protein [Anaerolineae bacterium]
MSVDTLQTVQELQFADKPAAEQLLLEFMRQTLQLEVVEVELRPLAVSLNSFNGFMQLNDGKRLFFKTHTEPDTVINEYYNAALLAEAGYPVIQPVYSSTDAGKQLLIYEVIDDPSVFDLAWQIENGDEHLLSALTVAQEQSDRHLFEIYQATLAHQDPASAEKAAVHQLFYHRLVGGRLERFYGSGEIALPDGVHPMSDVRQVKWQINGQIYADTLGDLIQRAITLLQPTTAGPAVVGHGDAHNGNVFFSKQSLLYFDPAFAGRHHPLLDLTKPLFHNVFAMWMYFPKEKVKQTEIYFQPQSDRWVIEYDYSLHPIREMFLESKVRQVLLPTLQLLQAQNQLREDWRGYLKSALFCCPLLTMNLTDPQKFPPAISLLGLAMSIEMGAESHGVRSYIDRVLDEAEAQLL